MQERVAVGFRCSHCDRPLPLRKTGIVTCVGCGGENYVELPPSAMARAGAGRLLVGAALGAAFVMALVMVLGGAALLWSRLRAVGAADRRWVDAPTSPALPSAPVVTSWPASPPVPGAHPAAGIVSWVGSGNAERHVWPTSTATACST